MPGCSKEAEHEWGTKQRWRRATYELNNGHSAAGLVGRCWLNEDTLATENGLEVALFINFFHFDGFRSALELATV